MTSMKRNNIDTFLSLSFIWMMCCFAISEAALNQREQAFIQHHRVPDDQKVILDSIFSHLDESLLGLFSGKNVQLLKTDILKLFKQAGFKIYTFHYRPLDHFDTDGRTARIVARHKKFPGYFLKIGFDTVEKRKNLSRVIYADMINNAIDMLGLKKFGTIEKKLYHRIGRSEDCIDFNYVVVVPRILGHRLKVEKFDEIETKKQKPKLLFPSSEYEIEYQALKAIVYYSDEYRGNFKIADDGKLYIIDTELDHTMLSKMIFETLNIID